MLKFYDKDGKQIKLWEWVQFKDDIEYWPVGYQFIGGKAVISTIWTGFKDIGLFETMVFPSNTDLEVDVCRYPTLEQALKGHQEMVKKWS